MLKPLIFFMLLFALFSCNVYKSAEKHINKKMNAADMTLYSVDVQGDTIEYWDNQTDKPVMVLVHGFGASAKFQWFRQIELFAANYRVIMPNLLHFGKTRPGIEKFDVQDQVEMVENLLTHLNVKDYSVCGVSYGGLIAMEMAARNPGINQVIAFDTPVKYMYESDIGKVKRQFEVQSIEELFAPDDEKGLKKLMYLASMKKSILPAGWLKEFHQELYAINLNDKRRLITHLVAGLEEYASHDYHVKMPVLLIWGSNDPVVPAERGALLKEHIGENATYVVIDKGAHMPNLTETKKFNRVLIDYLELMN